VTEAITEAQHQAAIIELAQLTGWQWYHTHDSRRCPAGFPDLVLVRPPVVLFVECKTDKGKLRPEQHEWLEALFRSDTVTARVWRPSDWAEIEETLTREAG
jgi:Holliday junction resolvase